MDEFFTSREQTMIDIKNSLDEGDHTGDTNKDLLNVLKREMITLMEEDVKLWHQLSDLNNSINDLKEEFFHTRCRSISYGFDRDQEQVPLDDEVPESKPRAFSLVETNDYTTVDLLFQNPFVEINDSNVITDRTMKENRHTSSLAERKYNFLNLFNPAILKSGLYGKNVSMENNMFLSSLHVGLVGMVDDLIKPLTNKHILPRRKLHRQSNMVIGDEVDSEAAKIDKNKFKNSNISKEINVIGRVSYERDKNNNSSFSEQLQLPQNKIGDGIEKVNNVDEVIYFDKSKTCHESSEDLISLKGEDVKTEDEEVVEINSSYLVFEDGYVSCRIMTPGLEEQIKLKNETEEEPLEYLKCKSGFARFRSGSDSESSYSDCQTGEENNDEVFCDVRYLFDSGVDIFVPPKEELCADIGSIIANNFDEDYCKPENDGECNNNSDKTIEDIDDIEHANIVKAGDATTQTNQHIFNESESSPLNVIKSDEPYFNETDGLSAVEDAERNFGDTDTENVKLSVDDTITITSREVLLNGRSVFVYKEKQCNFTYRISSVDSGIGDEIND